ncbi:MAG: hypothetical protein KAT11_08430, partial [Phycisphaerae bacterium]|nr:hypothetical protein [Phycisphaerae bacterium]
MSSFEVFLYVGIVVLMISIYLCMYRISRGPTAPDRTVAIDILGVILVSFCAVMAIITKRDFY